MILIKTKTYEEVFYAWFFIKLSLFLFCLILMQKKPKQSGILSENLVKLLKVNCSRSNFCVLSQFFLSLHQESEHIYKQPSPGSWAL